MDNVDENLHATLEVSLEQRVNKRLKPEEGEDHHLEGNNFEGNKMLGNNFEGNHDGSQDHFHHEEMSEGSEVLIISLLFLSLTIMMMMMMMMMLMMMMMMMIMMMMMVRWVRERGAL